VSIDGVADDGGEGEGDNIGPDVESVSGGQGDDELSGNAAANSLVGRSGDDRLFGRGGDDALCSNDCQIGRPHPPMDTDSNDTLYGGAGDDTFLPSYWDNADMQGDAGVDTVDYFRTYTVFDPAYGVHVSLDGVADDGSGDNVRADIENVIGTHGSDVIRGSMGANLIDAKNGGDTIDALGGDDFILHTRGREWFEGKDISGGTGRDTVSYAGNETAGGVVVSLDNVADDGFFTVTGPRQDNIRSDVEVLIGTNESDTITGSASANSLFGLDGDDTLDGLGGDDTLDGAGGNDLLTGGAGLDRLLGGIGNDVLDARDGVSDTSVDCGAGARDRALLDGREASTGCEVISGPA
jgi:Ca2+-binding RTX toxin-like protein